MFTILFALLAARPSLANSPQPPNPLTLTSDIPSFCASLDAQDDPRWNEYNEWFAPNLSNYPDPVDQAHYLYGIFDRLWPWTTLPFGTLPARYTAFVSLQEKTQLDPHLNTVKTLLTTPPTPAVLQAFSAQVAKTRTAVAQYLQKNNAGNIFGTTGKAGGKFLEDLAPIACLKFDVTEFTGCQSTIENILSRSTPVNSMILYDLIDEMTFDPSLAPALNAAALQVIDRYENNDSTGNLFEDVYNAFIASGYTADQSFSYTFKTLGFISVAGSETGFEIADLLAGYFDNGPTEIVYPFPALQAVNVLTTFPLMLDLRAQQNGTPLYSYPPFVNNDCQNGKNYHFWLAAYLSWDGASKFKSEDRKKGAQDAVWIMEQSYQKMANNYGRNYRFDTDFVPTYDPFNNHVRRDLTGAAAATRFGREASSKHALNWNDYTPLDADAALIQLFSAGELIDPLVWADLNSITPIQWALKMPELTRHFNQVLQPEVAYQLLNQTFP